MPTDIDYALMSANVYGNSDAVRKSRNTLPFPDTTGWTKLAELNIIADGFMATAYTNGTDIVIAYAGTTDENGLDWLTNVPAAAIATPRNSVFRVVMRPSVDIVGHPYGVAGGSGTP